jgi:hypothetical protein
LDPGTGIAAIHPRLQSLGLPIVGIDVTVVHIAPHRFGQLLGGDLVAVKTTILASAGHWAHLTLMTYMTSAAMFGL